MWRQLRVKNVFAKNTWNPNIYCELNLELTSSSIQSASVVYLLKQNYKCPWKHLNSCISSQLLLGWQPKICFNYRGLDPHAVCHQTNCTLATLTHPRSLKNRRLENLVLCLNIPQKALLTEWRLLSVAKNFNKIGGSSVVFFCEKRGPFFKRIRIFSTLFQRGSVPPAQSEVVESVVATRSARPNLRLRKNWWFLDVKKKHQFFCNGKKNVPVRKPY